MYLYFFKTKRGLRSYLIWYCATVDQNEIKTVCMWPLTMSLTSPLHTNCLASHCKILDSNFPDFPFLLVPQMKSAMPIQVTQIPELS